MSKQLLLLFLLLSSALQAQRQYTLTPFEDYTNCTTGFLNAQGDTIWPAQFDRIMKPVSNEGLVAQGWIAVYQGMSGLLSAEGNIVLPFEYEHIRMGYEVDVYQVFKEQKIGLYDKDGKMLYPMEMDVIAYHNENILIFRQDGKVGMLLNNRVLALPPVYDNIEEQWFYTYDPNTSHKYIRYLQLEKDKKYGLADANGQVIFDDACCPFELLDTPNDSMNPLILIHSEKGVGLLTFQKEILIPAVNKDLFLIALQDPQGHPILYAHVTVDEENIKLLRIDPPLESNSYDELTIGKNAVLFRKKNKQGYLNADLEEQYVKTSYELRFGSHLPYFSEEMSYSPDLPFVPGSKEQAVLVLAETETKGKSRYRNDKSYGLINVQTGKRIKPQFQTIWSRTEGNEVYYYAFDQLMEDAPTHLSIYNSQLELIDTFGMSNGYWMNFNDFFRPTDNHPAFVFKNLAGKMGAIDVMGKAVIPFIYDELRPQSPGNAESGLKGRLAARIGNKHGVIDWKGKDLIPVDYDFVHVFPDHYQIAAKPNAYVLYDRDYNKVIADCQYITKTTASALRYYNRTDEYYLKDNAFFAVKQDTAYAFFKEGFKPLNEKNINHNRNSNGVTLVGGRLLIEKSGKCILYKDYIQWTSPKVYYFQEKDSICFFHIEKGVTVCTTRSTVNASIDSYIHVNQHPNKEGLISKESGEWVLEPNDYFKILTDGKKGTHSHSDHFWYVMKGDEGLTHSMWIYDQQEKGKLERKFDVPMMNICGKYNIARSGGKFGLLDSNYAEALPFAYKNIIYSYKQFFVKGFDNRWSAWTPERGLIPLNCSDISLTKFTKGRLIFDGNNVAVLSDSMELVLPFTPVNALPESVSLYDLLGTMLRSNEIAYWNKSLSNENSTIGRMYNNKVLCELGLVYSTRHQLTEAPYLQNKTNGLKPVLVDEVAQQIFEERALVFIGKRICSYQETISKRNKAQYLQYNNYKQLSSNEMQSTYCTFVLEDKNFRTATLEDIFLPEVGYIAWLDNYLTEVINKKQLFGLQCMNLPSILDEYKQHFHVERGGISFSLQKDNKPIVIPWSDLKGIVRSL